MLTRCLFNSSVRVSSASTLVRRSGRVASRAFASLPASEPIVFASRHDTIDIPQTTIWAMAQERAAVDGDRNAFIDGLTDRPVTFTELVEGAKRVAVALAEDGVRKGDVRSKRSC